MGRFKKGEVDEYGDVSICVRGHSNAIHELVLPPIVMRLVNWKDGDRVDIVQSAGHQLRIIKVEEEE